MLHFLEIVSLLERLSLSSTASLGFTPSEAVTTTHIPVIARHEAIPLSMHYTPIEK
jgi:hypothetical protein